MSLSIGHTSMISDNDEKETRFMLDSKLFFLVCVRQDTTRWGGTRSNDSLIFRITSGYYQKVDINREKKLDTISPASLLREKKKKLGCSTKFFFLLIITIAKVCSMPTPPPRVVVHRIN